MLCKQKYAPNRERILFAAICCPKVLSDEGISCLCIMEYAFCDVVDACC